MGEEATAQTMSFHLPNPCRMVDGSQVQQGQAMLGFQQKLQAINELLAQGFISDQEFIERRTQILRESAKSKPRSSQGMSQYGQQGMSQYGQQASRASQYGQQASQMSQASQIGGGYPQPQRAQFSNVAPSPSSSQDDPALRQLEELFQNGFIDQDDYEQRKRQLVGASQQPQRAVVGGGGPLLSGPQPQRAVIDNGAQPQRASVGGGSPQRAILGTNSPQQRAIIGTNSPQQMSRQQSPLAQSPSPSPSSPSSSYYGGGGGGGGGQDPGKLPDFHKKKGPVSDNEQNRMLSAKREQERKVRTAKKRKLLQQLAQEREPPYNDNIALPFPQEIVGGVHNSWVRLSPQNQSRPASEIQKINELLMSGQATAIEDGLRYLTHLTTLPQFLQILANTSILRSIVHIMCDESSETTALELSCWVCANLSTLEPNRPLLRQSGALGAVVPLLRHADQQVSLQALSMCSNLLQDPMNNLVFEQTGGARIMISLLPRAVDGDLQGQQSVIVRVICIMGFGDDDIRGVVLEGNGIQLFLRLLYSNDVEIQRFASHALSSLAADGTQNDVIREAGGLPVLLHLLGSTDPFIREKMAHLLANLSANDTNMEVIREENKIPMLVELAQSDYEPVQLPVMWIISNILLSVDNQNIFEDLGGIELLVNNLTTGNGKLLSRVGWALVNLTQFSDFLRKSIGEKNGMVSTLLKQLMGGPAEGRSALLRALVNLLLTVENERLFLDNRGVEVLLALIRAKEPSPEAALAAGELIVPPQEKELCLMAMVNISKSDQTRNEIKNKEGLQVIMGVIYRPTTGNMQLQALRLLTNLVINGRIRYLLKSNPGVLRALNSLCESPAAAIKRQAEICRNNLSFHCTEFDESNIVEVATTPQAAAAIEMAQKAQEEDLESELDFAAQMLEDLDIEAELGTKPRLTQQSVIYLTQDDVEDMQEMTIETVSSNEPVAQRIVFESITAEAQQAVVLSSAPAPSSSSSLGMEETPQEQKIEILQATQPQRATVTEQAKPMQLEKESALAYQEMIRKQQEKQRKLAKIKEEQMQRKLMDKREREKREEEETRAEEARAQHAKEEAKKLEWQMTKSASSGTQQQFLSQIKIKQDEAALAEEKARKKREDRRMNIAAELLVTERTYVEGLEGMVKKFMQPMLSAAQSKKPPISDDAVKSIFSNVEQILMYHQMLLEGVDKRVSGWNPNSKIGDIFVEMVDRLKCYASFVNNYDLAVQMLTDIEEKSPAFHDFLQQLTAEASKAKIQNLFSLMVLPVQRIPRYEMMFTDLIRQTPEDHQDLENLKLALQKIVGVARAIDEAKHKFDCELTFKKVTKSLIGRPKSLIHKERELHTFGDLTVNKGAKKFFCLLFNDILTITKTSEISEIHEWVKDFELQGCSLKNYKDSGAISNAFGLVSAAGDTFLFNAADLESKNQWLARIQKVLSLKKERIQDNDLTSQETKRVRRLQHKSNRGSKRLSALMNARMSPDLSKF